MNAESGEATGGVTVLGASNRRQVVWSAVLALVGLVVGLLLPLIANTIDDDTLPDPWDDLLETVAEFDMWLAAPILAVLGLVAGIYLARTTLAKMLKLTVSDERVVFEKNKHQSTFARENIHAVCTQDKDIVLRGADGVELHRQTHDFVDEDAARIEEVFTRHGYPWNADAVEAG